VIHEVFRRVAAVDPAATALVHRGAYVSYGVLDRLSDALGAELRARGVGPGRLVPVLLPRSPEWVVALLAVLKCGAGYAAMDPNWPDERVERLIQRLDPPLTVVAGPDAHRVSWTAYPLGDLASIPADPAAPLPPAPVTGSDVSTVFLTSGSSGEPKVVLSPHRATVRMFVDCEFARFDPSTVMPQGSPVPWDGASLELWGPLLTGGTSVLLDEPHLQPSVLRALIAEHGLNTVFVTTSLFNVLVDEHVDAFRGLRVVMTGGERLSVFHVRRFRQAHPDIELVSAYGPVESTIFTTTHRIGDEDTAGEAIPLGRPVHNTGVAVLDGEKPCPAGEVGEICVVGAGLASGYLGDPALTASRFVEIEVADRPYRMYRTGDFGYLSDEGVLHFVGRRDRQVKIRGHRVEPEEIEARMLAVPGVTRGVVVPVREAGGAGLRLVAFYTAGSEAPTPVEVTAALRNRLPAYLVPEVIRRVPGIPLSATGKADPGQLLAELAGSGEPVRSGGPTPSDDPAAPAPDEPPRDELERVIAAEFAGLLGGATVGRSTDFFAAGGTSLDMLRLSARLARRLGRQILQSSISASPTVAGLAARLRDGAVTLRETPQTWSDQIGVPLLPMQRAFWLTSILEPSSAASHCVSVWRQVDIDPDVLVRAVQDVYRRHPGLRARIVLTDAPVAIVDDDPAPVPVPTLSLDHDPLAEIVKWLNEPFDLERGQLFRAALAEDPSGPGHLFGIAVHHAFYDEWSENLVVEDLLTAVAAREAGHAPTYARPVPSLAQVYECHQAQLDLADLDLQRSYWLEKLRDLPRLPSLAPDTQVPAVQVLDPVAVTFSADTVERLRALARRHGGAISQILVAALAEAVCAVTGVRDLVVGVGIAKRGHPTLANAVTCLLDAVAVRLRDCGEGLDATLTRCRPELIGALSNQDLPVTELTRSVEAGTARGRPPYDLLVVLQHGPHPRLRAGVPVPLFQPTSRELVAEARPRPDGGLTIALLHADRPGLRGMAERIAAAVRRTVTTGRPAD
jgi:amino acid adenylation domain-containing protein